MLNDYIGNTGMSGIRYCAFRNIMEAGISEIAAFQESLPVIEYKDDMDYEEFTKFYSINYFLGETKKENGEACICPSFNKGCGICDQVKISGNGCCDQLAISLFSKSNRQYS